MALEALGYPRDHPDFVEAVAHFDRLITETDDEIYFQPCFSPVWDTAYAAFSLAYALLLFRSAIADRLKARKLDPGKLMATLANAVHAVPKLPIVVEHLGGMNHPVNDAEQEALVANAKDVTPALDGDSCESVVESFHEAHAKTLDQLDGTLENISDSGEFASATWVWAGGNGEQAVLLAKKDDTWMLAEGGNDFPTAVLHFFDQA